MHIATKNIISVTSFKSNAIAAIIDEPKLFIPVPEIMALGN